MIYKLCLLLALVAAAFSKEVVNHGPHVSHQGEHGEHNAAFDHEAVLGSEDLEDEFAGLEPDEARRRLVELARKHDGNADGFISKEEMYRWMIASFLSLDREEAIEKFEEEDINKDGQVTFDEYLDKNFGFTPEDVEELREAANKAKAGGGNDDEREQIRTVKMIDEDLRRFRGADQDGNGQLNDEEYIAFFFPANFQHMHKFEMELYMDENDKNGDGQISKTEFVIDPVNDDARISAEENFNDLDKDEDGILTLEEIKPWVIPEGDELAMEEGDHLMKMADTDRDGKLSLEEIGEKTQEFVGSSATDYGSILRHEEL